MRVIVASLLVAAPALVSALATPVRRSITGFATYYLTQTGNAGACGDYLNDEAFTVAMNQFQYEGSCGKTVSITANGKTTQATVKDLCPEGGGNCHYGDMDMSPGLFRFFYPEDVGKFAIEWDFTDGSAPPHQDPPYVEPPSPTTPTQDPTPVVAPPPPTIPTVDSSPVYENAVAYTDEAPVVEEPTTTSEYVETTPTPWTESTDSSTTTDSSSVAAPTTTPSFADQVAMAMKDNNVTALGAALVELGNMLQNSTDTADTATTTTATY